MKLISIVTPCYNEEGNIELLCKTVEELFKESLADYDYEHIFIDNCSTDNTIEILRRLAKNNKRINVYGHKSTMNHLTKRHDYLFRKISSYQPILKSNILKSSFSLGKGSEKINFKAIKVKHGNDTNTTAYIFEKIAYISDTNDLSIVKIKELKNLKFLIIDCLKLENHPTHLSLDECLYVRDVLKPKKTILTNLHHDLDYSYLIKHLPKNVMPAFDGLNIKF